MVRRIFGLNKKLLRKTGEDKSKSNVDQKTGSPKSVKEPDASPNENDPQRPASAYDASSSRATSSFGTSSIFSRSRYTSGTGSSSAANDFTYGKKKHSNLSGAPFEDVGKPLRIVDHEKFSLLNPVLEEDAPNESTIPKDGESAQAPTATNTLSRTKNITIFGSGRERTKYSGR